MSLREAVRIALRGLRTNRLRSVLTMLGIIIGVAAVILLVAIGNGVQASINERIEPLANLITIDPIEGKIPGGGAPRDLIDADVAALQKQAPDISSVTPAITAEEVVHRGGTEHHHCGGGADLGLVEERSCLEITVVHLEPAFGGPGDGCA